MSPLNEVLEMNIARRFDWWQYNKLNRTGFDKKKISRMIKMNFNTITNILILTINKQDTKRK